MAQRAKLMQKAGCVVQGEAGGAPLHWARSTPSGEATLGTLRCRWSSGLGISLTSA